MVINKLIHIMPNKIFVPIQHIYIFLNRNETAATHISISSIIFGVMVRLKYFDLNLLFTKFD